MAVLHDQVSVANTATTIVAGTVGKQASTGVGRGRTTVIIKNPFSGQTVAVGNLKASDGTTALTFANGFLLEPGETVVFDQVGPNDVIKGIVSSGTQTVYVLFQS